MKLELEIESVKEHVEVLGFSFDCDWSRGLAWVKSDSPDWVAELVESCIDVMWIDNTEDKKIITTMIFRWANKFSSFLFDPYSKLFSNEVPDFDFHFLSNDALWDWGKRNELYVNVVIQKGSWKNINEVLNDALKLQALEVRDILIHNLKRIANK